MSIKALSAVTAIVSDDMATVSGVSQQDLAKWEKFKALVQQLDDQLLATVLLQVRLTSFQADLNRVCVALAVSMSFFREILEAQRMVWIGALQAVFGEHVELVIELIDDTLTSPKAIVTSSKPLQVNKQNSNHKLDLSDSERWSKTTLLLDFFPGTVTEVHE